MSDTSGGIYLSEDINGSNFIEFYRNLTRLAVIALLMSVGFINDIDWGREKSAIGDLTNKENWLKILAFLINTRSPDALNASKNLIAAMVRRVDLLQCSPASILCSTSAYLNNLPSSLENNRCIYNRKRRMQQKLVQKIVV